MAYDARVCVCVCLEGPLAFKYVDRRQKKIISVMDSINVNYKKNAFSTTFRFGHVDTVPI